MALKVLLLRKRLTDAKTRLNELRSKETEFRSRESELESDIENANTEDERAAVETAVSDFEKERAAHEAALSSAEQEISDLETEIAEAETAAAEARNASQEAKKRSVNMNNKTRKNYRDMTLRDAAESIYSTPEVRTFVSETRDFLSGARQRSLGGAALTVPEVMLDVVRCSINRYSKLITKVRYKPVKGKARQNIIGDVPEAVWTEVAGAFNEINVKLSQIEADAYKVAGYVLIPNAYLDGGSDVDLLAEVLDQLGQSVGLALDKAIVYGTGTKMPVGIVTRLAASAKPAWWGMNQADFTDLHTSHIKTLDLASADGKSFFGPLLSALGVARRKFAVGEKVWLMSETTHTEISVKALGFNSAAALVSGVNNEMPVLGGEIIELPFIPDGDIVGGYLSHYLLCERGGVTLRNSEHARFLQDQTVALAEGSYDGKPLYGEAFSCVNYKNTAVSTTATFTADAANTVSTQDDNADGRG